MYSSGLGSACVQWVSLSSDGMRCRTESSICVRETLLERRGTGVDSAAQLFFELSWLQSGHRQRHLWVLKRAECILLHYQVCSKRTHRDTEGDVSSLAEVG